MCFLTLAWLFLVRSKIGFRGTGIELPIFLEGGFVFITDGSGLDGRFPFLRVAGWGASFLSASGSFLGTIYGGVPPEFTVTHTARDGEDYAMYMFMTCP